MNEGFANFDGVNEALSGLSGDVTNAANYAEDQFSYLEEGNTAIMDQNDGSKTP